MSAKYPYSCARCGYCCNQTPCKIAKEAALHFEGVILQDGQRCPYLKFEGALAVCGPARRSSMLCVALGIGQGCCTRAWVVNGEKSTPFASLHPDDKRAVVAAVRAGAVKVMEKAEWKDNPGLKRLTENMVEVL